jgi:phosphoglycolate phosphatase
VAPRYQNILFDLDGTLTDSAEGVVNAIKPRPGEIRHPVLRRRAEIADRPAASALFSKEIRLQRRRGAARRSPITGNTSGKKGIYENRTYPGIPEMLQQLRSGGARLYLATSKPTVFAEIVLKHFKIDCFFEYAAGSNLDGSRIDKAEVIDHVLGKISSLKKEETVMVGDREHDIIGAKANGLDSVAVTYGYGPPEELTAAGPTYIVHSVDQLAELLKNQAGRDASRPS